MYDSWIFWKNFFALQNWENGSKMFFLCLLENLVIHLYWICSLMKLYTICFVPAQISYLGKILKLKLLSTNQIAGFLNQHFACTNSQKLKIEIFLSGHGQRWVWPVYSQVSKIDSNWRMNRWNKLMLVQIQGNLRVSSIAFGWTWWNK